MKAPKYAYWTSREWSALEAELEQTNGVVHLGKPSPRMKRLLNRHSPRCIRAYAYRMLKDKRKEV